MNSSRLTLTPDGRFLVDQYRDDKRIGSFITSSAGEAGRMATRYLKPPEVAVRTEPYELPVRQDAPDMGYGSGKTARHTGD